jgi:hypothetical protein
MYNMKCPSFPQACISIYKWVWYVASLVACLVASLVACLVASLVACLVASLVACLVASLVAPFFPAKIMEVVGRLSTASRFFCHWNDW